MVRVTRRISFCYGHRLLDYDGPCAHPHGHNGLAEVTIEVGELDHRAIAVDFSEIKAKVKGWIDDHLDHRFVLRSDDPLLEALRDLGEPVHVVETNPTAETIAELIFEATRDMGLPVRQVRFWETPSSYADYVKE